jgi:PPOX class probable F420-dependent enzyme
VTAATMRLDEKQARERFAAARVARFATVSGDGLPHLVPVTFVVSGDTVFFAVDHKPKSTANLRRLRNIEANPAVTVLVDSYDEDWTRLWWVRVDGLARILTTLEARAEPVRLLQAKYAQYREQPPSGVVVSTAITAWHGWTAIPA